jgi:hypothetical protein
VDPRHYTPSKTHRLNDVFPQNLVVLVRAMVQNDKDTDETDIVADLEGQEQEVEETEDVDEDDLPLQDIDKYAQKETFGEVDIFKTLKNLIPIQMKMMKYFNNNYLMKRMM